MKTQASKAQIEEDDQKSLPIYKAEPLTLEILEPGHAVVVNHPLYFPKPPLLNTGLWRQRCQASGVLSLLTF